MSDPFAHASGALAITKRVRADLASEPAALEALAREARFLSLARHAAVPRLFEVGRDERGPFIVEEAFEGTPLANVITGWETMPPLLALHVVREAAKSLSEIHALADDSGPLALVHGDPSPDNIVVSPIGAVRFVDFGEASHRGAAPPAKGMQHGTPPYAAPELLRGEAAPSQSTDVYAIGAIATALLTGVPLRPETEEAARLVALAERGLDLGPLSRSSLDITIGRTLAALVAFEPAARDASLDDLVRAIDRSH